MDGRRPRGGIFPRFGVAEDVDREIRSHLDLLAEELEAEGWDPAGARAEAQRRFGDLEAVARACTKITTSHETAVRRGRMMGDLMQDVRYAVRTLARAPGFTAVALLTLALGIGANTAIFSVVNAVLLRPLPYADPHELVYVAERSNTGGQMQAAWPNVRDWRAMARSFDGLTAFTSTSTTVLGGAQPAWTSLAMVSEDFWRVFPVTPLAGRLHDAQDHQEGAPPTAVVTRAFAREVLGTEDAVGRVLEAFGRRAEVVGVVPSDFDFPTQAQLWVPLTPGGNSRTSHNYGVVARLADGVALETAAQELDALTVRIVAAEAAGEPSDYLAVGSVTVPLHERVVGDARRPLYMLLGAAGLVLLVACSNLASTLLARGTVRGAEFAVRSALGAGRRRIVRQLLTESAVLGVAGAGVGLLLAFGVLRGLRLVGEGSVPRLQDVGIDGPVLAFTLLLGLVTAVIFGLLPAWKAGEGSQAGTLRSSRGGGGHRGTWGFLVAAEVALALMLLVGSGLLVRSFRAVLTEEGGFDASDVALTNVALSGLKYPELADHVLLWDELLARTGGAPGVSAAGLISSVPMGGFVPNGRLQIDGAVDGQGDAYYIVASGGAFEALDIPLLQGRLFQESDGPDDGHVVVVSKSFADRYWPGEDPIGRRVTGGGMDNYWDSSEPVWGTVVGVVGDVRFRDLTRAGAPTVYWHYKQRPFRIRFGSTLIAEAGNGVPAGLATTLRTIVGETDSDVAVRLRDLSEVVSGSVAQRRFILLVLAGFAGVALVLAAVGIYGVVSYTVARRTQEMGIRLALGASPDSVQKLVLSGALRPVVPGLVLGLVGAFAVTRVMQSLLYEVPATDPITFAAVPVVLLVAAVAASWVPARRGTKVDPIKAMRSE